MDRKPKTKKDSLKKNKETKKLIEVPDFNPQIQNSDDLNKVKIKPLLEVASPESKQSESDTETFLQKPLINEEKPTLHKKKFSFIKIATTGFLFLYKHISGIFESFKIEFIITIVGLLLAYGQYVHNVTSIRVNVTQTSYDEMSNSRKQFLSFCLFKLCKIREHPLVFQCVINHYQKLSR